jgi:formate hydrogenlyase subunit 3/multisubunit Na+/H+ antiporter MnhD subunit
MEMVNHGLTTGALFFIVGMIYERRGTLRISELGGLQKSAPILATVMIVVTMSAIGLPGLNGFVGEFLVLVGTFITHRWWAIVATTGIVSGAIYMLWAYQRIFQGVAVGPNAAIKDISVREMAAIAPLLAGIVFLGVYPAPFLDRITPAVGHLLDHAQVADPGLQVPSEGQPKGVVAVPASQAVDSQSSLQVFALHHPAAARGYRAIATLRVGAIATLRVGPATVAVHTGPSPVGGNR